MSKPISIEITMNRLVTDRWTIFCRRKPTGKEQRIQLDFKKPVNGMQIVECVQNLQNEKGSQFSQFLLFRCIPTAEEPATEKQQNRNSPPAGSLADHAAFMRQVRANLPRVTSADAHAQARRVLAAAREQDERARNRNYAALHPHNSP